LWSFLTWYSSRAIAGKKITVHIPYRRASLSGTDQAGIRSLTALTIEDVPRLTAIRRVLDEVVRLRGLRPSLRRAGRGRR